MVVRVLGRAVAVPLVGIAAVGLGVLSTPAPAAADPCGPGAGVSVVVDFRELGGGLQSLCDPSGGGKSATALFADNGYPLSYASRTPGFVCRVSGVPMSDPCTNTSPTTAYWGLYWSDGSSGSWAYASSGADSLVVPAGGSVAFAWQGSGQRGAPAVSPPATAAAPTPTVTPTPTTAPTSAPTTSGTTKPTKNPTKSPTRTPTKAPTRPPTSSPTTAPTSTGSSSTASPTESSSTIDPSESATTERSSESPSSSATEAPSTSATDEPRESTTESASPTSEAASDDEARAEEGSNRVPTWLTLTILGLLIVAIGMSTYAARRRTRH